jgi:hypothetical protein
VKPVAVLQHYEHDGVGYFGERLRSRGIATRVFELFNGGVRVPRDLFDLN